MIRWDSRVYAIRNICPHMGARLSDGKVGPRIVSEHPLQERTADRNRPVVLCPWHGWTFDLLSGCSLYDPDRHRVRSYPVTIEAGRVIVDMGRGKHAAAVIPQPDLEGSSQEQ